MTNRRPINHKYGKLIADLTHRRFVKAQPGKQYNVRQIKRSITMPNGQHLKINRVEVIA